MKIGEKFRTVFDIVKYAEDLQSSASPLRHEASSAFDIRKYRVVAAI